MKKNKEDIWNISPLSSQNNKEKFMLDFSKEEDMYEYDEEWEYHPFYDSLISIWKVLWVIIIIWVIIYFFFFRWESLEDNSYILNEWETLNIDWIDKSSNTLIDRWISIWRQKEKINDYIWKEVISPGIYFYLVDQSLCEYPGYYVFPPNNLEESNIRLKNILECLEGKGDGF